MKRSLLMLAGLLMVAPPALAQRGIRWSNRLEEGFQYAQAKNMPVMLYVRGRSEDDDDFEDFERDHRKAFADPRVVKLADGFVNVRMSRSRYRNLLEKWKLSPKTNLEVVFATPDGKFIDILNASAVANADALAAKMSLVLRSFHARVYMQEIQPILKDEDAEPQAVINALQRVQSSRITAADKDVLALLKREDLNERVRKQAYETLAELSTPPAAQFLFDTALAGDRDAERALYDAKPPVAEYLMQFIGGEDMDKHLLAYRAAARITNLSRPKNDRFWSGPLQSVKDDEIERIRKEIRDDVARWKRKHGD